MNKIVKVKKHDLMKRRFGRLIVVEQRQSRNGNARWFCRCDCGNEKEADGYNLVNGLTQSCGCLHKDRTRDAKFIHGESQNKSKTKEYRAWSAIKTRCYNTNEKSYADYGARGITVCDRWLESFTNFLEDMGRSPNGFSIERIDNNKGYQPGNCIWADKRTQANNTRANRIITCNGKTATLAEWSRYAGIKYDVIIARIDKLGWEIARALTQTPRRLNATRS